MLRRSKYSRLRSGSPSLEDWPLILDSDLVQGTPAPRVPPTLRDFIPRVANIRLQSPAPLRAPRAQTNPPADSPTPGTDRGGKPPCRGRGSRGDPQIPSLLSHTKRPIALQRLSGSPGCPSCLKNKEGLCCSGVGTWNRAVHHRIKYMGSVEVIQSMRTLDFETRVQVTREAISRLCTRTSSNMALKTKRTGHKGPSAVLGQADLQFSGSRIILSVCPEGVTLISASSLQRIAHHSIQSISFASGGEPEMADYIAFVAKDPVNHRACHILECEEGQAADVISSISRAFQARFRQLLRHAPGIFSCRPGSEERIWSCLEPVTVREVGGGRERHDYYNVIPGKTPPPGGLKDLRLTKREKNQDVATQWVCLSSPASAYENCSITEQPPASPAAPPHSSDSETGPGLGFRPPTGIRDLIGDEGWFHGRLGRAQAESLLTCSGDFLVRESSSACGQYILSGMEGGTARHLLLVDPHGQVRTWDQVFLSVGHLVRFHMQSQMPIISGSFELCLKQPILQRP